MVDRWAMDELTADWHAVVLCPQLGWAVACCFETFDSAAVRDRRMDGLRHEHDSKNDTWIAWEPRMADKSGQRRRVRRAFKTFCCYFVVIKCTKYFKYAALTSLPFSFAVCRYDEVRHKEMTYEDQIRSPPSPNTLEPVLTLQSDRL